MNGNSPFLIFEDDLSIIRQADFCALPGYLIVRFKNDAQSIGDLNPPEAARVGTLLASTVSAIETVTGADRVYCIVLAEIDRNLHFHLFPRTTQVLSDYHKATGRENEPTNGTLLFEWAREAFPAGTRMSSCYPEMQFVCSKLRTQISGKEN